MPVTDDERLNNADDPRYTLHVHTFSTETDVADNHQHSVAGVSGPPRGNIATHVHRLRVRTSYLSDNSASHWHWVDILTGPPIAMPNGTHAHYFQGSTSFNQGHSHTLSDVTGIAPNMLTDDDDDPDDCDDYPDSHYQYKPMKRPDQESPE